MPHDPSSLDSPEEVGTTDHFRLVFVSVLALTILALALNVVLTVFCESTAEVRAAADSCSTTYKLGFGTIVGLVGGKAS